MTYTYVCIYIPLIHTHTYTHTHIHTHIHTHTQVHGTLKACGESAALKSKYGLGYRLHCMRANTSEAALDTLQG